MNPSKNQPKKRITLPNPKQMIPIKQQIKKTHNSKNNAVMTVEKSNTHLLPLKCLMYNEVKNQASKMKS